MVAVLKMPAPYASAVAGYIGPETSGAERRVFPRREVHANIEGQRLDHSVDARQNPHLSLALRDLSLGGLSAISDMPIKKGERLSVFFPPQGTKRGWDATGRVLRCDPSGVGYRLAVEFDPLPMAA